MSKSCISHHFACDCREARFAALKSENEKLRTQLAKAREGLSKIEKLRSDEITCDPADYEFNAEDAYSGGSMDAFNLAADMAKEALTELDGMEKGEKPQPVVYGTEGESGV